MRIPVPLCAAALALLAAAPAPSLAAAEAAAGMERQAPEAATGAEAPAAEPAEPSLDTLYEELRTAADADAATRVEQRILRRWLDSGSDTVDLLMDWAIEAMAGEDYPLALDYLDAVVTLAPDFAEGWNKRASVHFLTDDYGKSISDIRHVLALEPRHFGALSGLGIILRELGRDDQAIAVFREALALHPFLKEVREALEELERAQAGQDI